MAQPGPEDITWPFDFPAESISLDWIDGEQTQIQYTTEVADLGAATVELSVGVLPPNAPQLLELKDTQSTAAVRRGCQRAELSNSASHAVGHQARLHGLQTNAEGEIRPCAIDEASPRRFRDGNSFARLDRPCPADDSAVQQLTAVTASPDGVSSLRNPVANTGFCSWPFSAKMAPRAQHACSRTMPDAKRICIPLLIGDSTGKLMPAGRMRRPLPGLLQASVQGDTCESQFSSHMRSGGICKLHLCS